MTLADSDFRRMVDDIGDYALLLLDNEGRVLNWNRGAQALTGHAAAQIVGHSLAQLYPAAARTAGLPGAALSTAAERGHFEDEGWRQRRDGSQFWAHMLLNSLRDDDGGLRGYAMITRDLTERRKQKELLRLSEERFRMLVDGVTDYAIFLLDEDGHVMSWNTGAQQTKGYTAAEIIGRHFSVFYPPEVAAQGWPAEELRRALRDGRCEDEGWRVRKDGSRFWASVVVTALHDDQGRHRGFAKITRDLTDKRRISALEDEGRRITTFLAMLGHELRNPLAPISNALFMMQRDEQLPPHLQAARDIITRQVRQVTRLVDDLLDVGRITSGKIHLDLQAMPLRTAIVEAVESAQPLMQQKSHHLHLDIQEPAPWVLGDHARIVQILGNLLSNAAKFTPSGGDIRLSLRSAGAQAVISVKDNGPGMPPETLQRVFNLFYQAHQDAARSLGGLGLGLSLVEQLVTLHGGDIKALSSGRPGEGSDFVIQLPSVPPPADATAPPAASRAGAGAAHVLIVDDNHDSADTLQLLLESVGYRATVAYSGQSALDSIAADRPDIVLMDIGLPDLSGLAVMRQLSAQAWTPQCIAITGYGQEHDRNASMEAGFRAHLTKPIDIAELLPLIDQLATGAG